MELITDNNGGKELMDKINHNIRGRASVIFHPYAKANNTRVLEELDAWHGQTLKGHVQDNAPERSPRSTF